MSEAIKVEVGQTWRWDGQDWVVSRRHENGRGWRVGADIYGDWFQDSTFANGHDGMGGSFMLIAPAPAKVEARSGCKSFCGWHYDDMSESQRKSWLNNPAYALDGEPKWCTEICRDAKYPPMGETKSITVKPGESVTTPWITMGPPKPEPAKAPKCGWSGANHTSAVLLRVARTGEAVTVCDGCWLSNEAVIADNVGGGIAPYTGPERLPRPQLAADYIDDTLPDAGR